MGEMRVLATHAPHRRIASIRQNLGFLQRILALPAIKRLEGYKEQKVYRVLFYKWADLSASQTLL